MMHKTEKEILKIILKNDLVQPDDKLLVGVSGGSDSLGLLYILKALESELKCSLAVAHLDHQLREDSFEDLQFVEEKAKQLDLPFYSTKVNVRNLAEETEQTLEEAARGIRYQFFAETA